MRPMTDDEFESYIPHLIEDYAADHVAAGSMPAEDAMERAEQQIRDLLPHGVHSEHQYLYAIHDDTGTWVGVLWFAREERGAQPVAFVYDIEIFEPYRRRGYGRQAFLELEAKARELDLTSIALHVFGDNHPARAMYRGLGYAETHVMMAKLLDGGGG